MARITRVAKAQQRYETIPVLDENGEPKRTPVMRKDGTQKTTKKGKPVFMSVTAIDKTKPKANPKCDFPGCDIDGGEILPGTPYMHITPRSGPYGGRKLNRHQAHRPWDVWDYSNSLSAQLARISYDFSEAVGQAESPEDVQEALNDAASSVKEIAEQKREGASNIEEGFGHPTSASEELEQVADDLEAWGDEIEAADVPDVDDCEECDNGQKDCDACEGTGYTTDDTGDVECNDCTGTGTVECENCDGTGEDINTWREGLSDSLTVVDEAPV